MGNISLSVRLPFCNYSVASGNEETSLVLPEEWRWEAFPSTVSLARRGLF
jgi:hypothetical protein